MLFALAEDNFDTSESSDIKDGFKSQSEVLDEDFLQLYVKRYLKKEDAILVSSSFDRGLNLNMVFDFFKNAGYSGVKYLLENEKLLKNTKKRMAKRGKTIDIVKGKLHEMSVQTDSHNVILDLCATSNIVQKEASSLCNDLCGKIFTKVSQALKSGGRYLCLMDACNEMVDYLLGYFKDSWFIRLQSIQLNLGNGKEHSEVHSPLILFILTKLKIKLPKAVLEVSSKTEKPVKLESEDEIKKAVSQLWDFTLLQKRLKSSFNFNRSYAVNFWCPKTNSESPRYTVVIVDSAKEDLRNYAGKYGVFIVPQGREIAWLFGTDKGRKQLASMSGFQRLAVISTHRGHSYESIDEIKSELSTRVLQLSPPGLTVSAKVPFVTVGEDIGQRHTLYNSDSGEDGCIVEDSKADDGSFHRCLIFHRNSGIVQTEYRLQTESEAGVVGEYARDLHVDKSHLVFSFHKRMIASMSFLAGNNLENDMNILLVGLGGAALPNFISEAFPKAAVTCVELNPAVVELAEKWFGFSKTEKMQSFIADGLEFMDLEVKNGHHGFYHAVIIDVNTDDHSSALTAPPPSFLEQKALDNISVLLHSSGIFIMNLVCRDEELTMEVGRNLKGHFGNGKFCGDDNELNVIATCFPSSRIEPEPTNDMCLSIFSEILKRTYKGDAKNLIDLDDIFSNVVSI